MTIYQNNIPQPTDPLSESQADLRINFLSHNEYFGVDHVRYSLQSENGKHIKSTYVAQGAAPTTDTDEIALYAANNAAGRTNLRARYQNNGSTLNVAPFCATRFELNLGGTVTFRGTQINTDQVATTWDGVSQITVDFIDNADNTNYYVFVQLETLLPTGFLVVVPTVYSKAAGSFIISYANIGANQIVNILVYEQ